MPKPNHFDTDVAATYDRDHDTTDPAALTQITDVLHDLAADGDVLEFAIGTGRIAVPLAARGCTVKGIELSQAMVDQLRKKPRGAEMEVAIGDMTTTRVPGSFTLVALVFNTIDNLTTQDAQVACFANAAAHLAPGGRFVVETLIPPVQKLPFGEDKVAFTCGDNHLGMDEIDVATQTYRSHHLRKDETGWTRLSIPFRYAWPAEFDLMAQMAGLTLEHRWGDWDKSAFTRHSTKHVSVWRKTE